VVQEHVPQDHSQWAATRSIAGRIGCTDEALRRWVREAERDQSRRPGLMTDERGQLKVQQREVAELKQAQTRSAQGVGVFCQAELDRRGDGLWPGYRPVQRCSTSHGSRIVLRIREAA
jgi:transposase